MKDKLGQEPAFATSALLGAGEAVFQEGMSKRFYAACVIIRGLLANPHIGSTLKGTIQETDSALVATVYRLADELLKQESE